MICIRVCGASTLLTSLPQMYIAHLDSINRVHNRVLLYTHQPYIPRPHMVCVEKAYSYARKSTGSHILQQREIGRKSFIAILSISNPHTAIDRQMPRKGGTSKRCHILILFYWLCIWLGHWGHGHRSSSERLRLQSQDVGFSISSLSQISCSLLFSQCIARFRGEVVVGGVSKQTKVFESLKW